MKDKGVETGGREGKEGQTKVKLRKNKKGRVGVKSGVRTENENQKR